MNKYYEEDVLQLLDNGEYFSAEEILSENIPTMGKRMTSAVKKLAILLEEVKLTFPDAMFYTASGGLVLMLGNSHDQNDRGQQQLIAGHYSGLINIGDGDF